MATADAAEMAAWTVTPCSLHLEFNFQVLLFLKLFGGLTAFERCLALFGLHQYYAGLWNGRKHIVET